MGLLYALKGWAASDATFSLEKVQNFALSGVWRYQTAIATQWGGVGYAAHVGQWNECGNFKRNDAAIQLFSRGNTIACMEGIRARVAYLNRFACVGEPRHLSGDYVYINPINKCCIQLTFRLIYRDVQLERDLKKEMK